MAEQDNPIREFEKSLAELEALVERMEGGELTLEESLAQFERGIRLSRNCQKALREAELKVETLLKKDGDVQVIAFDAPPESE